MREELPNRQSIRKKGWDYTAPGWYFVTINTQRGVALFGTIVNGRMVLSEAGRVAEEEWRKSAVIRRNIELDAFVVMPNHVHGVVRILPERGLDTSSPFASSPCRRARFGKPIAGALGTFVGAYKAAVSREMNRRGLRGLTRQARPAAGASAIWHRNYWDVIVRDEKALANIRHYIRSNPQNYDAVMNVGEPRFLGNKALMDRRKLGFLASRGKDAPHGRLLVKPGEAILSGFLSPMERAVFRASLENKKPVIWVKPWGLREEAALVRLAIEEDRLLIVSPFDNKIEVPSARRAAWCNQYVLAHCDRLVVGHLNPGGMLACILSEANPEMEITHL
jgi:REP element-mobilizing transposase RayT